MKKIVKLTEGRLNRIIQETVKKVINEKQEKEVFTISAIDIINDEVVNDMHYCGATYYSADDAIDAAEEFARTLVDEDNVIIVSVFAGEYETENGDVFGEPFDIYSISNKDKRTTAIARKQAGYVSHNVDSYVGSPTNESKSIHNTTNPTDYFLTNAPRTKFARNDNGKMSMDTLKTIHDGGMLPDNTTPAWAYGHDDMEGIVDTYYNKNKEKRAAKNMKRSDKRWEKSSDSRPLHRKDSLNRVFDESNIHNCVKESIQKVINEKFDGYDDDLDYERVYDSACHYLLTKKPKIQDWRSIAKSLGFRMNTIGPNDMETLKDAIQDAMADY